MQVHPEARLLPLEEVKELYDSGFSLSKLGDVMGVSKNCARNLVIESGAQLRPKGGNQRHPPHSEYAKTAFFYERMGWSTNEIAEYLGLRHSTVVNRLEVHGVQMRTRGESARLRWQRRGYMDSKIQVAA